MFFYFLLIFTNLASVEQISFTIPDNIYGFLFMKGKPQPNHAKKGMFYLTRVVKTHTFMQYTTQHEVLSLCTSLNCRNCPERIICQKIGLSALRMGQKWTKTKKLSNKLTTKTDRWKGKQWRNELLHSSGKPRSIGHIILPVLLLGLESTIFLLLPDSPATVSNMHTLIFCYIRSSDKLLHLYKSFIHSIPPAKVTGSTY